MHITFKKTYLNNGVIKKKYLNTLLDRLYAVEFYKVSSSNGEYMMQWYLKNFFQERMFKWHW